MFIKNLDLKTTILIGLVLGLMIPTFLTTAYLASENSKKLKKELTLTQMKVLKAIASGLARPLWEFSHDDAQNFVDPIFKDKIVLEIIVFDLKYTNKEFLSVKKKHLVCEDAENILVEEYIYINKLKLGKISMLFSTCQIIKEIVDHNLRHHLKFHNN